MKYLATGLVFLAAASTSGLSNAGLMGATVNVSAENGFSSGSSICKTAAVAGVTVAAGDELTANDWSGACVGSYTADISDSQIVLSGFEQGNYTFASFRVDITSGSVITAASFSAYTPDFFSNVNQLNDSNFFPTVTYGSTFVEIVWDALGGQFNFNGPGNGGSAPFGTATFAVTTGGGDPNPVPAPATLLLCGLGLAGLGWKRHKQA